MKRSLIILAVILFLAPILGRTLWFYQGIYQPAQSIQLPDYEDYQIPAPQLSTPVPAEITDAEIPSENIVLFDITHQNLFKPTEIDPLLQKLDSQNAVIQYTDYNQFLADQLTTADAFVIIAPTIPYTAEEIQLIHRFIERGGRLLTVSDPTRQFGGGSYYDFSGSTMDGVDIINSLLEPYEINLEDGYVYNLTENEGNFRNIILKNFETDEITKDLNEIVFYSSHSIHSNQTTLVKGSPAMKTDSASQGEEIALIARSAKGNLVSLADLTFMTAPYHQVADNPVLVSNIAQFLVDGSRIRNLEDFPHIFSETVHVSLPEDLEMDKDVLDTISSIQDGMSYLNRSVVLTDQTVEGQDQLILTTYEWKEDIVDELDSFGVEINQQENGNGFMDVTIPGLGELSGSDIGLFLYSPSDNQNRLILIADSFDSLRTLTDIFNSQTLFGCIIQENIAICPLDSNFSPEPDFEDFSEPDQEPFMEEFMEPTPEGTDFPGEVPPQEPAVTPMG